MQIIKVASCTSLNRKLPPEYEFVKKISKFIKFGGKGPRDDQNLSKIEVLWPSKKTIGKGVFEVADSEYHIFPRFNAFQSFTIQILDSKVILIYKFLSFWTQVIKVASCTSLDQTVPPKYEFVKKNCKFINFGERGVTPAKTYPKSKT
jgi:hypothetical protein